MVQRKGDPGEKKEAETQVKWSLFFRMWTDQCFCETDRHVRASKCGLPFNGLWVQCTQCRSWIHGDCANIHSSEQAGKIAKYICSRCKPSKKRQRLSEDTQIDDLAQLLADHESKKRAAEESAQRVGDAMLVKMCTGVFPRDANGFSQSADEYVQAVKRIRDGQKKGHCDPDLIELLDGRELPIVRLDHRAS